ncbi:hypothetical protein B0H15DRAFT_954976 [Mycena belliarum]|uniref:Uncharacterized protein n=1 Tax=Mycena belliarum TaxID=1033014 RepID=A0AAD6TVD6_9AGAR|nr:hypothetical protein B0H15DRAFT_954976 [Mycena belliae]
MAQLVLYTFISVLVAGLAFASSPDAVIQSRATSALSFTDSQWIWTPTTTANAFVGLRKDFTPPFGRALISAEIIISAVSAFNLYVNGNFIGPGTPPNRGRFAQRYCVDLLPSYNVFAVNASTTATTGGGLLATILLTYTDGSTDTLLSDGSWRVHTGLPAGWKQLSFDDTAWRAATVAADYAAGAFSDVLVNIPSDPPVLALTRAQWIWTDVVPANGVLPAGSRAFRRTFTLAPGQTAKSANILISADNSYTLYINGHTIGSGTNWPTAQHYVVDFATPTTELVIAVFATNTLASPAGVIFAMEVNMQPAGRSNCTAGSFLLSDAGWKSTKGAIPSGFEQPGFDDSTWPAVTFK